MLIVEDLLVPPLGRTSLRVRPGECLCLTGPSGSGKSRLLRAVADLDESPGGVTLDGVPRESVSGGQWRSRVMLVPAESRWWADRVRDHFRCTPDSATLEGLGLDPRMLDADPSDLSSGERQRLALLRAVERNPRILLLDEPTSNLDGGSVARVERWLLTAARGGCGLLWVSHDPAQVARVADAVLEIRDGRLLRRDLAARASGLGGEGGAWR